MERSSLPDAADARSVVGYATPIQVEATPVYGDSPAWLEENESEYGRESGKDSRHAAI